MENKENLELEMDISQESEITEPVVLSKGVKSKRKGITADTVFVICNTIFMILFVVITLYPVLNTVALSFNDGTDAVRGGIHLIPRKFSIKNYTVVLHMQNIITGAIVTVARTVIGTLLALVANALLAYIISRKEFLFKSQLSLFWVITMYVNGGLIPVLLLYKTLGLTNSFWVYVIPGMVSIYNRMKTEYTTLQYELMKLLSSVMQQSGSATSVNAANVSTVTPVTVRSAATVITMLPIICLYPFLQRYFVAGLTIGGVKE